MRRLTYIAVALTMLVLAGCADNHPPSDGGLELTWMLQRATRGNGINVVIMGDAYTIDELVHDGKFHRNAITVMESFFSTEPVASMREYFNIYAIGTPSSTDNYNSGTQTYFSLKLTDDGSSVDVVDFDDSKVWRLVRRNIPGSPSKNVVVILHQNNRSVPRDRCLISFPEFNTISFVSSLSPDLFSHETVGHGLALLADEHVRYDGGHPGLRWDNEKRPRLGFGGKLHSPVNTAFGNE